jgi:hypothetical protein
MGYMGGMLLFGWGALLYESEPLALQLLQEVASLGKGQFRTTGYTVPLLEHGAVIGVINA